jgi:hypothetical protein
MHAFDGRLLQRTLGWGALVSVVTLAIVMLTDESFSTAPMRVARMAAFAPGLAALGAAAAMGQAQSRGELGALHALGASPWRASRGALFGGWLIGAISIILLSTPLSDVSALFPALAPMQVWEPLGASLVDLAHGVIIDPSGDLYFADPERMRAAHEPGAGTAIACVASIALVTPIWLVIPIRFLPRLAAAAGTTFLTVLLLHGAAAGRIGVGWLVLAATPIALQALLGYRSAQRLLA